MNISETADFVSRFDRLRPAYAEWRINKAKDLASVHGTTQLQELREMLASLSRELSSVTTIEAADVLCDIEAGRAALPFWGELGAMVRAHASLCRQSAGEVAKYFPEGPRYRCIDCFDNGYLTIFNPYFVKNFRHTWENFHRVEPVNFLRLITKWWRERTAGMFFGALSHSALCDCDCHRRNVLKGELAKFRDGQRRSRNGGTMGPPACGNAEWNRDWGPAWPCNLSTELWIALSNFYSTRMV